jgi:hypothetical protein
LENGITFPLGLKVMSRSFNGFMQKRWMLHVALALCVTPLAALPVVSVAAPSEAARPEVANAVKAYSGGEGLQVWTLRVGPRSANEFLVQLTGVDHPWEKHIFKTKAEPGSGGATKYVIEGKDYVVLVLNDGGYGEAYLPPKDKALSVSYDDSLSSQGNPEAFLTDYLKQPPLKD